MLLSIFASFFATSFLSKFNTKEEDFEAQFKPSENLLVHWIEPDSSWDQPKSPIKPCPISFVYFWKLSQEWYAFQIGGQTN